MNSIPNALIITRRDIRRLLGPADFLEAVELGFQAAAMGKAAMARIDELGIGWNRVIDRLLS